MLESIQNCLRNFSASSLEDAKAMAFLNRFDTKYVLKNEDTLNFLQNISSNYSILKINECVIQSYNTIYFDTPSFLCYNMHHNKRMNRFKFRTRHYLSNGKIFNEIKQKLNTGKTIKFRRRRDKMKDNIPPVGNLSEFDEYFRELAENNGYRIENLIPQLYVNFNRLTFLNKNFPERLTLDFDINYRFNNEKVTLNNTVIIELKRNRSKERTIAQDFLRRMNKNPGRFSKYIMGVSLIHNNVKKNRFLPRLKKISYTRSLE